jgi:two-component system, cell cycle sensor histidine kinase and response regulator CckA
MLQSIQQETRIKILPALAFEGSPGLREADRNEIAKTAEGLLPRYLARNIDVKITLVEKNLKIMADKFRMKEALTYLIKNAMDTLPEGGVFSLRSNQVSFEVRSLLNGDNSILGVSVFISPLGTAVEIDEKIKERIFEPFFTIKPDGKAPGLAIVYRIINQCQRIMKAGSRLGQTTEVNLYLPLTRREMVNMMSIPVGATRGRYSPASHGMGVDDGCGGLVD